MLLKNYGYVIMHMFFSLFLLSCFFRIKFHIAESFVHVFRVVLAYLLMLAVMSYNAWIGIAVVVGEFHLEPLWVKS